MIGVILFHYYGYIKDYLKLSHDYFSFGSVGVQVFFIISGFIIYYSTVDYTASFASIKKFIIKRFFRIYPLYILATILFALNPYVAVNIDLIYFVKSILFMPAMKIVQSAPQLGFPVLWPGWTLNYEVYFYLIFNLFILFSKQRILLLSAYFVAMVFFVSHYIGNFTYLRLMTNEINLYFLLGTLIGYFYIKSSVHVVYKVIYMLLLLVSCYLIMPHFDNVWRFITFHYNGIKVQFLLIQTVFLLLAFYLFFSNGFLSRALVKAGDISYELYLFHFVVLQWINYISFTYFKFYNYYIIACISIIVSFYVSNLIYTYFELRILKPLVKFLLVKYCTEVRKVLC